MNAIFDENSEFLNYLKQKQKPKNSETLSNSADGNPNYLSTDLENSNRINNNNFDSTFKVADIDLKSELGEELFNEFAQKTNLPIPKQNQNAVSLPLNNTTSNDVTSQTPNLADSHFVLNLKDKQLKEKPHDPDTDIPVKKVNSTQLAPKSTNTFQSQDLSAINSDKILKHNVLYNQPTTISSDLNSTNKTQLKKLNKINKLSQNNSFTTFIVDKLKFLIVSGIIFVITFVAINWSAYSKIFQNWYLNIKGSEYSSPLLNFQNGTIALLPNGLDFVENTDVPKLNIEVTPPGMRIIIPRLRSNVPVIGVSDSTLISNNWDALESEIQEALRDGVVHYPGTPYPNQSGNVVLTGHSSYYPWDPGRFKDVFAVLHQAAIGDEIIVFYDQKKYLYQIIDIKKVLPSEVNVLGDSGDDRLTLITCTPIGTNLQRLIVTAKPIK